MIEKYSENNFPVIVNVEVPLRLPYRQQDIASILGLSNESYAQRLISLYLDKRVPLQLINGALELNHSFKTEQDSEKSDVIN